MKTKVVHAVIVIIDSIRVIIVHSVTRSYKSSFYQKYYNYSTFCYIIRWKKVQGFRLAEGLKVACLRCRRSEVRLSPLRSMGLGFRV